MRIIVALAVYFILANLGDTILEHIGLGVGDAYGFSYISGTMNFSLSGVFASCVLATISATALLFLDEDGIAFAIACIYWLWQIWGDFGERSQIGWIGFFIITLENVIMLSGLIIMNTAKDKIKKMGPSRTLSTPSNQGNNKPPTNE